jgi:hypothetical protein
MEEYEVDITNQDFGELVEMIRVQHCKLHKEPFARSIGITQRILDEVEEGKGKNAIHIIRRINELIPGVEITLNVRLKKGD